MVSNEAHDAMMAHAELKEELDRLIEVSERMRKALKDIATSKYQNYGVSGAGSYGIGVADGHRYCANIAKEGLVDGQDVKAEG